MKAGKPEEEENYHKKDIEGIPFYIRNEMFNKAFSIDWVGFWIIGSFVVKEL